MGDKENEKELTLPRIKTKIEHRTDVAKWTVCDIDVSGKDSVEVLGTFKEVLKLVKDDRS